MLKARRSSTIPCTISILVYCWLVQINHSTTNHLKFSKKIDNQINYVKESIGMVSRGYVWSKKIHKLNFVTRVVFHLAHFNYSITDSVSSL